MTRVHMHVRLGRGSHTGRVSIIHENYVENSHFDTPVGRSDGRMGSHNRVKTLTVRAGVSPALRFYGARHGMKWQKRDHDIFSIAK